MLEGAAYVGFHVTLHGAGRRRSGGNRSAAWLGQYDARRLTQPLAEAHAAACSAAIRRHYCHYGDDLGDGPLNKE